VSTLRLAGVSKAFGAVQAVVDCSLEVADGEFLALLGPSGCGKTTLLRMLGGFVRPDRGGIWIGDRDVAGLPPFRRNIGFTFQSYALFPHLTVRENVAFGLRMRGRFRGVPASALAHVRRYLDLVRLPDCEERYPHQLSGGQQQRVALARALATEPDVLLLDEPLGSLDKKLREAMQVELKALQRTLGVTTVFVTHDQEEALAMADRIAVMSMGRIEQTGRPAEVYEAPRTRFVSDFIGVSNFFPGRVVDAGAEGSAVRFRTAAGVDLEIAARAGGAIAGVMVRPEKVEIHLEPPAGARHPNAFPARVVDVLYQGTFTRVTATLGDAEVAAVVQNAGRCLADGLAPGRTIYLSIDPASFCVFGDDGRSG